MNILLWVLQLLLAVHTLMGAIWKFSNPAQTLDSLHTIPQEVWLAMSVIELLCSLGLVLSVFKKSLGRWVPVATVIIASEMLFFSGMHLFSGNTDYSSLIYWLVVAAICAFIAYGRLVLKPIKRS